MADLTFRYLGDDSKIYEFAIPLITNTHSSRIPRTLAHVSRDSIVTRTADRYRRGDVFDALPRITIRMAMLHYDRLFNLAPNGNL